MGSYDPITDRGISTIALLGSAKEVLCRLLLKLAWSDASVRRAAEAELHGVRTQAAGQADSGERQEPLLVVRTVHLARALESQQEEEVHEAGLVEALLWPHAVAGFAQPADQRADQAVDVRTVRKREFWRMRPSTSLIPSVPT